LETKIQKKKMLLHQGEVKPNQKDNMTHDC